VLIEVLATASAALRGAGVSAAEGTTTQILAGGRRDAVKTGPVLISTGRATLAPGARLAWEEPAGAVLLHVETGNLDLATRGGSTWVRPAAGGVAQTHGLATLAAGDGALIGAGTDGEVRNAGDGSAEILIITLFSVRDESLPSTTSTPSPASTFE
jgi:hypothetical protein